MIARAVICGAEVAGCTICDGIQVSTIQHLNCNSNSKFDFPFLHRKSQLFYPVRARNTKETPLTQARTSQEAIFTQFGRTLEITFSRRKQGKYRKLCSSVLFIKLYFKLNHYYTCSRKFKSSHFIFTLIAQRA